MAFSTSHLITYFLLVFIPYSASINFYFPNIGTSNQNVDIFPEGTAFISDSGIHITPDEIGSDRSMKSGRATYVQPLHLWDRTSNELASFSTNFTFVIDSDGSSEYADGLTFFLAENNSVICTGGCLGLPFNLTTLEATNSYVAVEFDTYCDDWDPLYTDYTICEHLGIDINSLESVIYEPWFTNISAGEAWQVWITYDSISKNLSFEYLGTDQDILVYTVDLRTVLPEWVIFGFSAASGSWFEKHTVKSWGFSSSDFQAPTPAPGPPSPPPPTPPPRSPNPGPVPVHKNKSKVGLVVGSLVGVAFLAVLAVILWRRKMKKSRKVEDEGAGNEIELNKEFEMGTGPKRFTYQELVRSTGDFSENEKLGEGGFGGVYKGFIKETNTYIAVKRVSKNSKQGIKEYTSEVKIISQLRHKNLVRITGWCHEKGELLLVYEYMENGSLDLHLYREDSLLAWETRYKIARGLASSLLYLHEDWEQCVLHRDIKSSNVMLDSNFNAKLGDFGLAKLVDHEKGSQTTMVAGTWGYVAPECLITGKATRESDVFSFGVVALEIACGRKPMGYKPQENQIRLVELVWELYGTGTLLDAADPRLGSDYDEEEIKRLMIVGLWCVNPDPVCRPYMRQVIQVLNIEASLPKLPLKMPIPSYVYSTTSSSYGSTSIMENQSSSSTSYTSHS